MSLIEQARTNLATQELQQEEQKQADELFSQMRQTCNQLLEQHGQRVKDLLGKTVIFFPLLTPTILVLALRSKVTPFELMDKRDLKTQVNNSERRLQVTLNSNTAVPSRSTFINVTVEGLNEFLILRKEGDNNDAQIHTGNPSKNAFNQSKFKRRANLQDAHNWQEVIDAVKAQYPSAPPLPSSASSSGSRRKRTQYTAALL